MKINFEKQFGKGTDPWYAKAERWAKKQRFPISFLVLGLISALKEQWIETKIHNEMRTVDADVNKIHELWDKEEKPTTTFVSKPSVVKGLDDMELFYDAYKRAAQDHDDVMKELNRTDDTVE